MVASSTGNAGGSKCTLRKHIHACRRVVVMCFHGHVHEQMESVVSFFENRGRVPASNCCPNQAADDGHTSGMQRADGWRGGVWPHVTFLPNAGLAAYSTWSETLQLLTDAKVLSRSACALGRFE